MKIRMGFVSNSSSSSFICDVSGEIVSGWDSCLRDIGMYCCENGHMFCEQYMLKPTFEQVKAYYEECLTKEYSKYMKEHIQENILDNEDFNKDTYREFLSLEDEGSGYDIISICCPLCMKQKLNDIEGFNFLLKKYGITKEDVLDMMREEDEN